MTSPSSSIESAAFVFLEPAQEDFSWSVDSFPRKALDDDIEERLSSTKVDTASAGTLGDEHLPPRPEIQDEIVGARPSRRRSTSSLSPSDAKKEVQSDAEPTLEVGTGQDDRGQAIYLVDEDIQLQLRFLRRRYARMAIWYLFCIVTAGIWYILDSWNKNRWWLRWNCTSTSLRSLQSKSDILVCVKSKHGEVDILPLNRVSFKKPIPASDVFTSSLPVPFESPSDAAEREFTLAAQTPGYSPTNPEVGPESLHYVDMLEYRSTTFLLHPASGKFRMLASWRDPEWNAVLNTTAGLSRDLVEGRRALFGHNQVSIPKRSTISIMIEEALHPFMILQLYSVIIWVNDEYVPYAIVIIVITLIGVITTTVTTKQAVARLDRMSKFSCEVDVHRFSDLSVDDDKLNDKTGCAWKRLNSEELVPGDVVDLCATKGPDDGALLLSTLPCDLVLLEGDCIVNESMLTGESVPVVKSPISNSMMENILASGGDLSKIDKHLVYSGTKIVRARPPSKDETNHEAQPDGTTQRARALVVRTGFSTAKGSLVRQMLFPRPINFKFYRDAFTFIGLLLLLSLIGLISTAIYFKIIGVDATEIALRSLDVLTIACPPALPATLSICITFAISRLRRAQIYCLSPQRINVAGKVNMLVFDKTGTLTEEGLDVLGTRTVTESGQFSELFHTPKDMVTGNDAGALSLEEAMATAHDLNMLDGNALGEPLEVKMLEWTGRRLEDDADKAPVHLKKEGESASDEQPEPRPRNADGQLARIPVVLPSEGSSHKKLAVIRSFAFNSGLRRMSVIVKREAEVSAQIYCKGAPEAIFGLCESDSLPSDYDEILDHYTRAGYRVLAVAGKIIEGMSWRGAETLPRSAAESRLRFLGLIVFENKLKAGTAGAIATLRDDARLPIKVCTGDSVLTAVSVAKECGIFDTSARVFAPRLFAATATKGDDDLSKDRATHSVEWIDLDNDSVKLDSYSLDPLDGSKLKDVELAVSGEIFRNIVDSCAKETLERILVHTKVFARMSPEQKQDLVERLQNLGFTVGFTGDGANDCGALKAADVGLSLSEAEASVAAPFTSRTDDISCVQQLLREGRSTLSVSFSVFKWMACYSLCEYMTVLLLYGKATSLDNAEYLFIDIFMVFPIAIGMANSLPSKKLHSKPPASRLASARPMISTLGQVVLIFLAQTVVYLVLHQQPWYEVPELDPNDLVLNNMDNTALFRTSAFGYIIAGICYSMGPPHRQHLYRNWLLSLALFSLSVFSLYFLFLTGGPFHKLFGFVETPQSFSWVIFGVVLAQLVFALAFEIFGLDYVCKYVAEPIKRRFVRKGKTREKDYRRIIRAIEHGR